MYVFLTAGVNGASGSAADSESNATNTDLDEGLSNSVLEVTAINDHCQVELAQWNDE